MVWSLKGILLFFFARITRTLPEERLVKWVSVVVIAAYIATIGVVSGHCRPVNKLWQVYPYPGDDCSQNTSKYYALVVTNVFTDLIIMYIPIPLLWRLQTTIKRKLAFGLMFCAGGFIILCTLLRCIICLHTPERLDLGLSWSIRETVIGIIATNAPSIKPLFPSRRKGSTNPSNPTNLVTYGGSGSHQLSRVIGRHHKIPDQMSAGSEERIVQSKGGSVQAEVFADDQSFDDIGHGDGIQVTREYRIEDQRC
ncbi:hypothetical protein EDB81DRAFT_672046 [Dactylonectria macrodidyma]|uniref:Rhodopsin domain-containing protein n=1 Tax=Dactylonectria macrodidyma TaxID=307937 RepID=A0A9P9D0P4_9HYPO|nr:hypothetical protein EDB81DRAFT_672046 [Dactylonectria macrodidyma]